MQNEPIYTLFPTTTMHATPLGDALDIWVEQGRVQAIDRFSALAIASLASAHPIMAAAMACVTSLRRGLGHVCITLAELVTDPLWLDFGRHFAITWQLDAALATGVLGQPGCARPLMLDQECLYFHKSWWQECTVAEHLSFRLRNESVSRPRALDVPMRLDAAQRRAVEAMLSESLCIISGGPGTGKTTVVAAALHIICSQAPLPKIAVAAPTGKAAARLQETLAFATEKYAIEVKTIHRLLAWSPTQRRFRYDVERPLDLDCVVLDEVSMLDLELMYCLLQALPRRCRLVLLGDRDQLASVQPGNVLADICAGIRPPSNALVELTENYRFQTTSAIGELAMAVNRGVASEVFALLRRGAGLQWEQPSRIEDLGLWLASQVPSRFMMAFEQPDIAVALTELQSFRILCAQRYGDFGSLRFNRLLVELLRYRDSFGGRDSPHEGELLMMRANDYRLGLYNGDIGLVRGRGEAKRVHFALPGKGARAVMATRLGHYEQAFAMTVHKSQGSEFDRVLLVLPEPPSPLLTRELLYTGITRARGEVSLLASEAALKTALRQRTERHSGLTQRLSSPKA